MKNFFLLISIFFIVAIITFLLNLDYIRSSNFVGKESIKKSFFYIKKKTTNITLKVVQLKKRINQ